MTCKSGARMSRQRDIMKHFEAKNKDKESHENTSKLQLCEFPRG